VKKRAKSKQLQILNACFATWMLIAFGLYVKVAYIILKELIK
jgi:hypothetical protein